jgi:hypothetical protein
MGKYCRIGQLLRINHFTLSVELQCLLGSWLLKYRVTIKVGNLIWFCHLYTVNMEQSGQLYRLGVATNKLSIMDSSLIEHMWLLIEALRFVHHLTGLARMRNLPNQ